jgi:hypothetical protein
VELPFLKLHGVFGKGQMLKGKEEMQRDRKFRQH